MKQVYKERVEDSGVFTASFTNFLEKIGAEEIAKHQHNIEGRFVSYRWVKESLYHLEPSGLTLALCEGRSRYNSDRGEVSIFLFGNEAKMSSIEKRILKEIPKIEKVAEVLT